MGNDVGANFVVSLRLSSSQKKYKIYEILFMEKHNYYYKWNFQYINNISNKVKIHPSSMNYELLLFIYSLNAHYQQCFKFRLNMLSVEFPRQSKEYKFYLGINKT